MPGNIAQYTSPIDTLRPSETGADALAQMGRHIGAEYRQIGQDYQQAIDRFGQPVAQIVEQHDTMAEVSQGAYALAAGTNNLQQSWNKTVQTSDPNDTTIQKKFTDENLEPFLEQWQGSFTTEKGQQWALSQADELRKHFGSTTEADMSIRAGTAVLSNTVGQLNQLRSSVYKDPSTFDTAVGQIDSYYDAALEHNSGLLKENQLSQINTAREDAKNELVQNAIKGYVDAGHTQKASAILDSGKYDNLLDDKEQERLRDYIQNRSDATEVADGQKTKQVQAQQIATNMQEANGIFSQLASGKLYPATLAFSNQNLSKQQRQDFIAKSDGILTLPQEFLSSPAYGDAYAQSAKALYAGQTFTPESITASIRRQEITPAGAIQLQAIADKMKTPEGRAEMNAQSQVLNQMQDKIMVGGKYANDPAGEKLYNNMLNSFYSTWNAGIQAGKTPAQLADPENKDYVGNIANSFKRDPAQALADSTAIVAPKIPALPAADQRVVGRTYPTATGVRPWLGNGWGAPLTKQPAAAAPQASAPRPE